MRRQLGFVFSVLVLGCAGEESQAPLGTLAWADCAHGVECATLEVPNDHAHPDGATQHIAVARARAGDPGRRVGALLLNLGGPGAGISAHLDVFRGFLELIAPELVARFDLVGFDPRGIGQSRPKLAFLDDATIEAFRQLDPTPDDDDERAAHDVVADAMAASAEQLDASFMSHVDTESVARDMDRLREALGESSVDYYGGSYGTLLGAIYATLFPERVRGFVLDSAVMPAFDRKELLRGQTAGYERKLREHFAACEASSDCVLQSLGNADDMYEALRSFVEAADETPLAYDERTVRGSDILVALGTALNAGPGAWLDDALLGVLDGDVGSLLESADGWYGRGDDGTYDDDIVDANLAISALDAPYPGDRADFDAFVAAEVLPESSLFAPQLAEVERTFVEWPFVLSQPLPTVHAPSARPLLILAGDGDPATPAAWSTQMRDALANGSSVVTHGAPVHGQLFASQCVRELAVRFLIDPNALPAETYCPPDPEE